MCVVFHPANLDRFEAMIARDAGHIGPEFFLNFWRESLFAVLGAKDEMDAVAAVGVRHGSSLRDFESS
jgi:hypothetical protein